MCVSTVQTEYIDSYVLESINNTINLVCFFKRARNFRFEREKLIFKPNSHRRTVLVKQI